MGILGKLEVLAGVGTFAVAAMAADKPTPHGCPPDKVWDEASGGCLCAPGTTWDDATRKCTAGCPTGKVQVQGAKPGTCIHAVQPRCPVGENWSDTHNRCVPACPKSKVVDAKGQGCVDPCPTGKESRDGACVLTCPAGQIAEDNRCISDPKACPAGRQRTPAFDGCVPICTAGRALDATGRVCVVASKTCPDGKEWKDAFDGCVPICPLGQVLDFYGVACHSIRVERRR